MSETKKVNIVTESRKSVINEWNKETRSISALAKYFQKGSPKINAYIVNMNKQYGTSYTLKSVNSKLCKFALDHELNKVDEYDYSKGDKKLFFSIAFMLRLLERKAKFINKMDKFAKYVEDAKDRYLANQYAKRLKAERVAKGLKLVEAQESKDVVKLEAEVSLS